MINDREINPSPESTMQTRNASRSISVLILRWLSSYSLRTKLILTFLAVTLIPLTISSYYNNLRTQQLSAERANETLLNSARQTAINIDTLIESKLNIVNSDARLPVIARYLNLPEAQRAGSPEEAEVIAIFQRLDRREFNLSSYALLDAQGVDLLDTFGTDMGSRQAKFDYFQVPFNKAISYVSPVQISPTTGRLSIYFSAPVLDSSGKIVGVIRMRYYAAILQQLIESKDPTGQKPFAVLFSDEHIVLAHGTAPDTILKATGSLDSARLEKLQTANLLPAGSADQLSLNLPQLEQDLSNVDTQPYFTAQDMTAGDRVNQAAAVRLPSRPWVVAFFQSQEAFLAPIKEQTGNTVFSGALIVALITAAAFGSAHLVSSPIVRLTATARQVAAGDLTAQVAVESGGEIGQLAESFNRMTQQLRNLIGSLEDEVRGRTADLSLSLAVGEKAASIRDLNELLPTITHFIGEQFNFYTQIYFVDDLGQNLILKTGIGDAGEELLARHHTLPVGTGSIVGQVAATGKSIVVPDTRTSDIHKPNPLLPKTRSEVAVPLIVKGRIIGVLDMQANEANTFTEANLTVFEAMATQLAISIDSAQQWTLAQEAQRKAEEAIRQLTRQSWAERLATRREKVGFAYDLSTVAPLSRVGSEGGNGGTKLAVPVVVQNEPIGQLALEIPPQRILSTDEQNLLTAVAQQLAQKAENLRLFEQTRQRATREQLARQIIDKIRASRDIESALKTAAEELAKNLGAASAVVDLKMTSEDDQTS
ncbi:MAG: GAF domain-containing protein [Chloroflexota bacterium]